MKFLWDLAKLGVTVGVPLLRTWRDQSSEETPAAKWTLDVTLALSPQQVRSAMNEFWLARGFSSRESEEKEIVSFRRGDWSITQLPGSQTTRWPEVPVLAHCGCLELGNELYVKLRIALRPMQISEAVLDFCRRHALSDLNDAKQVLMYRAEHYAEQTKGPSERPRHRWMPEDDFDLETREALGTLGVEPGSSWAAIQAAYRELSLKFHPDRQVGVAPHLAKLAEERFKEVNSAYQWLKEGRAQSA